MQITRQKTGVSSRSALVLLITTLLVIAFAGAACAPAPAPAPTPVPPTQVKPTVVVAAPPTAAPTIAPTQVVVKFDIKATLDKYVTTLPDGFGGIQPAGLKDQLATTKPFILDVREPGEIAQNGFIEGAVNIPLRTLTKNLDKLPAQDKPIITVCPGGQKGGIAMTVLQVLGYSKVKNLVGGFNAWKAAKLPIATGTPPAPVAGQTPNVDRDLFAAVDKYVTTLPDGFGAIQPAGLQDLIAAKKVAVIDVRDASEVAQKGKIEGSINVPLRTLVANLDKLPADKGAPIVTYCPVGQKGVIAMTVLQLLGYTNVKNLLGGFNAWTAASLPVVK